MVGTDRPGVAASPAGDPGGEPGGDGAGDRGPRAAAYPRLARHRLTVDGHRVGVAVGGQGVPLVLASGLLLTDRLYVQTLSRLAACGFRVVAVDVAGSGISDDGKGLDEYGRLLGRVLETLEVERAVLAGHSLGGRLVTELAARRPERVVALLLVDASVGAPWDMLVRLVGYAPPSVGVLGAMLLADTLGTVPFARDLGQAAKLSRLAVPVMLGHLGAPWRLLGPGLSALYAAASAPLLDRVGAAGTPVVVVHGAAHSFLLQDPETLPAIVRELLEGRLGEAWDRALAAAGLGPDAPLAAVDEAFAPAGSRLRLLGPPGPDPRPVPAPRPPHYTWTRTSLTGLPGPAGARR
jgi:pimeloyl-ACP methyl ester carboxylesterase